MTNSANVTEALTSVHETAADGPVRSPVDAGCDQASRRHLPAQAGDTVPVGLIENLRVALAGAGGIGPTALRAGGDAIPV